MARKLITIARLRRPDSTFSASWKRECPARAGWRGQGWRVASRSPPTLPVTTADTHACCEVEHLGAQITPRLQCFPWHRYRDRRPFTRAQRIGTDGRGAATIAQIVDEDAIGALHLGHVCGKAFGRNRRKLLSDALRKGFHGIPVAIRLDRRDDVQTFAASGLQESRQAEFSDELARQLCRLDQSAAMARRERDRDQKRCGPGIRADWRANPRCGTRSCRTALTLR